MMATENEQAKELADTLWKIANDLRGNMDASKFRNYILGVIFYRYLSEHTETYVKTLLKNDGMTYEEALADPEMSKVVLDWEIDKLGYIIEPEYLFNAVVKQINDGKLKNDLVQYFEKAIVSLTASTVGQKSEPAFDKLFDDMNLNDKDLGKEVSQRSALMAKIILRVSDISFDFADTKMDILGTAYMILIGLFASDAGKKGGEFFTPTNVSVLLARLLACDSTGKHIKSVYDPTAGSGSLLLQVKNLQGADNTGVVYAQEMNGSTYNLLRMNLIMHGLDPDKFKTYNGDTILNDGFPDKKFEIQAANPPYGVKWDAPESLLDDHRFSAPGALPPKSHEEMAFLEHMVAHMDDGGKIACLMPLGVLFRGNSEYAIRKYLINELNVIDAVIGLPVNLFHGASIPVCVIICRKEGNTAANKRNGNSGNILIVDASKYFTKDKSKNLLEDSDVDRIVDAYKNRATIDGYSKVVSIADIEANDFNLNISRYVDSNEKEDDVDLASVNITLADSETTTAKLKKAILNDVASMTTTTKKEQKCLDDFMRFLGEK